MYIIKSVGANVFTSWLLTCLVAWVLHLESMSLSRAVTDIVLCPPLITSKWDFLEILSQRNLITKLFLRFQGFWRIIWYQYNKDHWRLYFYRRHEQQMWGTGIPYFLSPVFNAWKCVRYSIWNRIVTICMLYLTKISKFIEE